MKYNKKSRKLYSSNPDHTKSLLPVNSSLDHILTLNAKTICLN